MPSFVRENCQRVGGTNVIQNRHGFRCISPAPESQICPRVIAEAIHSERRPFLACSKDEGFQSARWIGQCAECACVLRQRALGEDRQKSAKVAISNCGTQSEVVGDDLVTIACRALPRLHLSDRQCNTLSPRDHFSTTITDGGSDWRADKSCCRRGR